MSFATKCNRCGVYYDRRNRTIKYMDKDYDLCRECAEEFKEFMNGAKPATLRELLRDRLRRKD